MCRHGTDVVREQDTSVLCCLFQYYWSRAPESSTSWTRTISRVGRRRSIPRTMSLSKSSSTRKRSNTLMPDVHGGPASVHALLLMETVIRSPDALLLPGGAVPPCRHRPLRETTNST